VVLVGPSHHVPVRGLVTSSADAFASPLGLVPIDVDARTAVLDLPAVSIDDTAHALEHSLEVQLPFLQMVLSSFAVVPLAVGRCRDEHVAGVLDLLWDGEDTLVVVSTDLSHYHEYEVAQSMDRHTAAAIADARPADIGSRDACGSHPLRGLLLAARRRHLDVELLDLRNSGDTAGEHDRVVGYGAFAVR
jgi:AmmeMemoRadiSam system protein B